jgi:cytochrome c551/c552
MTLRKKIAIAIPALLLAMQVVTCARTNPPVTKEIDAPPDVKAVLERSCYDCHSNKTVYPWYSHVAPSSWLMYRDVTEGRQHLNFTEWDKVPKDRVSRKLWSAVHEVKGGDMPLWFYLPLHPKAKLSDADKALLEKWVTATAGPPPPPRKHKED